MRTEFVYSVAALAAFPILVNAQTEAISFGKVTATKDGVAVSKEAKGLVPGKYSLITSATTGTAGKKATVTIKQGTTELAKKDFTVGQTVALDFTVTSAGDVTVEFKSEAGVASDFVADGAKVNLDFDFSAVASKLLIEYNKLSTALATYQYEEAEADIRTYSSLYDRITAIANADYKFYAANTDGLQALYADQSSVTGLALYTEIGNAFDKTKADEYKYYLGGGNGVLDKLNARYSDLAGTPNYQTKDLTNAKNAATKALTTWNSEPTVDNHEALKKAAEAYKTQVEARESVKKDNETTKTNLDKALAAVYGNTDSYYAETLKIIEGAYTANYADLKKELLAELNALVASGNTAYTPVKEAIQTAYGKIEAKAQNDDLTQKIKEFKESITRIVSEFNGYKDTVTGAYDKYNVEKTAADEKTKGAADFLTSYKAKVDEAVAEMLAFIQNNDTKATVANLSTENLNAKIKAITDAKNEYSKQAGIYGDYQSMKADIAAKTKALTTVKTDIDKYAKDTKKLAEGEFKPTTIWASTITAINDQISAITAKVDAKKTNATAYKNDKEKEYVNALTAIDEATNALKNNANAATDSYATIKAQIKAATDLKDALNDPAKEPKVDLSKLEIWTNQVTTNEAIKARTPYNKVINTTIDGAITTWKNNLNTAIGKTAQYDPSAKDKTGNILGYLNSVAETPANVLKNEIETMNAIKANYKTDEEAFKAQVTAQEIAGIKSSINAKAADLEARVALLQKLIDEKKVIGNVTGGKLQTEIDAITKKINTAKETAANADATKADVTTQYDIVTGLSTDMAVAEANADKYKIEYATFQGRYNTLNGTKDDASSASTVFGLKKKVVEQENAIKDLAKLTDAQKNIFKANVNTVKVERTEGDKKVSYTKDNILSFIESALKNEVLDAAEVTKYQGIIEDLKTATNTPVTQAQRMNDLEGQLAAIDFAAAKTNTLKNDPNESGYYYQLLTGTAKAGQYTFDFNKLKADIEADKDITAAEVSSYGNKIAAIKGNVEGMAAKAKANLEYFNAEKKALALTRDHKKTDKEQWYGLTEAIAELEKSDYASSVQADQLTTLRAFYDKITQLGNTIEDDYKNGKYNSAATANGKNTTLRSEINNYLEQCTNEVNYNAQVAKDNKAIYDAITAAHKAATEAYQSVASDMNGYNNLQSQEMKSAIEQAKTEYDALIDFLYTFEETANGYQKAADDEYGKTVSPTHFDAEESHKAKFEALVSQLKGLQTTFVEKIKDNSDANVVASIDKYTKAINASKAKVKTFSATDKNLTDAEMTAIYGTIDGMLKNINDAKAADDVKALDKSLLAAENGSTGIEVSITNAEQAQALKALKALRDAVVYNYLPTSEDRNAYNRINKLIYDAERGIILAKQYLVDEFADDKTTLKELKTKADQNAENNKAVNETCTAIAAAQAALDQAYADYDDYVAGIDVKPTLDAIKTKLAGYPTTGVNPSNAEEWKAQAESITKEVAAVYEQLFDKEVSALENGLLNTAKNEYITYKASNDATAEKGIIDSQTKALEDIQKKVALPKDNKDYVSKTDALTTLKNIETALNDVIAKMQTANETNVNASIVSDLNTEKSRVQDALNNAYEGFTADMSSLSSDKAAIQTAINELGSYITDNAANMKAYKANADAKIKDIDKAIADLKVKAQGVQNDADAAAEANAQRILGNTWANISNRISTANAQIAAMNKELGTYGSGSKYANKVSKLEEQTANAQSILEAAQAKAEGKDKTADKQAIANEARTQVNTALNSVASNCADIIALAKDAYISEAITAMQAELAAITWNPENYTSTDQKALNSKKSAITTAIAAYKTTAEGQREANVYYTYNPVTGRDDIENDGVIRSLEKSREAFDKSVDDLKTKIKEMSLVGDIRGHVQGNDDISVDDIQKLTEIVANGQTADLDRCDVNGDGSVTVTDIIWLQYFWAFNEWPDAPAAVRSFGQTTSGSDAVTMETVATEGNITRIAVSLTGETPFRAFQIAMQLPEGAKVVGQHMGDRVVSGWLMHSEAMEGNVRFMTISENDKPFTGSEGAVLYVDIENLQGEVVLTEALFTDTQFNEANLQNGSVTTGIRQMISNALEGASKRVYNIGGAMMDSLRKGINIIRNADGTTQKVLKK